MKRLFAVALSVLMLSTFSLKADEGMWLLPLLKKLNIEDMQAKGLKLSAEDIYSINQSSLKDAIVIFGGGCTGELISDQGLILTNHHCGYGAIQYHSSVEHDYLEDGFWAMNKEDELHTPDLSVTFLKRIEDVTEKINSELNEEMSADERSAKIREISKGIEEEASEEGQYRARVQNFFAGNDFYLMVYEVYPDVRMVGVPPSSIGKFGGDTDNWEWPRHTGDFSMFRVYAAPDGSPAEYSEENVPLKPKHHLPVSLKGVEEGDYTMIMGYPGGTDRYMTSWGVKEAMNITNPTRIKVRTLKQQIMMKDMKADAKVRIQYASKYSRSSNYWKYSIGQNKGLQRLNVVGKKEKLEDQFRAWVNEDIEHQAKYGEALPLIKNAYQERKPYYQALSLISESFFQGPEVVMFSGVTSDLLPLLKAEERDDEAIKEELKNIEEAAAEFYKDYNMPTDQKLMAGMFNLYAEEAEEEFYPSFISKVQEDYNNNYAAFADYVYSNSIYANAETFDEFLDNPTADKIENDPAVMLMNSIRESYYSVIMNFRGYAQDLDKGQRLFLAGLREMQPDRKFYPDANFTMRLTYGTVGDYYPRDAVHYDYYTTMKGIMEKEDPNNDEFVVPEKLKELYEAKDYGQYGEGDVMKVCFISNNDITGGNSGSPVINGKGELIGLAFDGNWEAMSGDIAFEPELQRTINVDIRYVLFVVDKFAGATNLIDEMTIVK